MQNASNASHHEQEERRQYRGWYARVVCLYDVFPALRFNHPMSCGELIFLPLGPFRDSVAPWPDDPKCEGGSAGAPGKTVISLAALSRYLSLPNTFRGGMKLKSPAAADEP